MYTALVLTDESQNELRNHFRDNIPNGWDVKCHHMTVNMGLAAHGPAAELLGKEFDLEVVAFAKDQNCAAVSVETVVPSNNAVKHITVAVNVKGGGKPKHSNDLKEWINLPTSLKLRGVVQEVQ